MKKRLFLILLYPVFLLALLEGCFRLVYAIPLVSQAIWVGDDLGWQRRWVDRRREANADILFSFDRYDPGKGWISKANLRDMRVFGDKVLNTNSAGFRGREEYALQKPPGKLRIVVLGDSFTFGEEVSDDETYAHYLRDMLAHAEVINMGMHGYGHDQMLILLEEAGVRYQPDIVLVGFLTMDMSRNLRGFRDYAKPRFVLDDGELVLTGTPVPRPEDILAGDWARPRLVDFASALRYRFRKLTGIKARDEERITRAILNRLAGVAAGVGAKPVFAYLPVQPEFTASTPPSRGEQFLAELCRENRTARCLSTRPAFAERVAAGFDFKQEGHWGAAAHRVAAAAIRDYLLEQELADPR